MNWKPHGECSAFLIVVSCQDRWLGLDTRCGHDISNLLNFSTSSSISAVTFHSPFPCQISFPLQVDKTLSGLKSAV